MNDQEIPHLTDEALVEIVQEEHWTSGKKALQELVDRNDVETAAEMVGTDKFRVKEILDD